MAPPGNRRLTRSFDCAFFNLHPSFLFICAKTEMGSLTEQWPLKNSSMSRAKEGGAKGKICGCNALS